MKNTTFDRHAVFFLMALIMTAFAACNTPEPEIIDKPTDTPEKWQFALSPVPVDPATALGQGGQVTLTVESPEDWTLSSNEDWLSVEPASGKAGRTTVTVTTLPNPDKFDHFALLTLSAGEQQQTDTFYQYVNIFRKAKWKTANLTNYVTVTYDQNVAFTRMFIVVPFPESNQYQEIRNAAYGSAKMEHSPEGVGYLYYYATSNFLPSGSRFIDFNYTVDMYYVETNFDAITHPDLPYDTKTGWYKRYTSTTVAAGGFNMINPNHPWVFETSNMLWEQSGHNRIEYARLCYEYVASHFTYGMYDGTNSVEEIIDRMSGDCGNQHAIWLSLMRKKGIPARPIVMNSPEDFSHVRGEFYVPGYGWIPVDVTYHQGGGDYFGKFTKDNLVVMNTEFAFKISNPKETYTCNLLQGLFWLYGISAKGEVNADFHFGYRN